MATISGSIPTNLPILTTKNYDNWKIQIRVIMRFQRVWNFVEQGYEHVGSSGTEAQKAAYRENEKKDCKALFILHQSVDAANVERLSKAETSKEAWAILEKVHGGATKTKKVKLQTLRRQYELLSMENNETVVEYITRVQTIVNTMRGLREKLVELQVIEKVLRTLPAKFDHIVVAIEESKNLEELSLEELQGSLESHEQRMIERGEERKAEQALQAQSNPKDVSKKKKKNKDRPRQDLGKIEGKEVQDTRKNVDHQQKKGRNVDIRNVKCYNCNKLGHYAKSCQYPNPRRDEARLAREEEDDDSEQVLLMVTTTQKEGGGDNCWYLDTGCSTHMTGRKDWFVNLDESIKSKVKFADDRVMIAEGVGKILIRRKNDSRAFITDVLFVPGMKSNLLSLGQLLEKGYVSKLEDKMLTIYDSQHRLLLKSPLTKNRMFKVDIDILDHECFAAAINKEEWLWHYRFGHLNFKDLHTLKSKSLVKGLPHINQPSEVCKECLECKQSRNSFKQHVSIKSKEKLEVVYSDVCDPIQTESLGGNRYFVSFIDDFSRKLWIYLIKRKSEVLEVFEKFKVLVERNSGQLIKVLRTDGGGEYMSREFQKFCDQEGIEHEVIPPYTPQHNGTAERKNRTIMNMVRSMLKSKELPKYLWGEAVSTTTYILNRSPSKRLEGVTPEEAWSGNKPNVSHFRVFGSICYRHVPDQLRRKLDDKGEQMVLLGYHKTGGYKLLNPISKQIVISRDVVFDESRRWNWKSSSDDRYNGVVIDSEEAEIDENQEVDSARGRSISPIQRRSQRNSQVPSRFKGFEMTSDANVNEDGDIVHFALFSEVEPVSFKEAIEDRKWVDAMTEEIRSMEKNQVWELVSLPKSKKAISVRWVFKIKTDPGGRIVKYKARLVVRGFLQRPDIDYKEVFAPVARIETIRTVVAIASSRGWTLHQLDIKSAFLNGPLEEEVYVLQPPGFIIEGQEEKVFKSKKALYGLKQAPRAWNKRIDNLKSHIYYIFLLG
uniref:Retrovirus-related Pol polyprotein from transposon TNT 1-94 n=1 Tax=Cajanus cajan TaxID=3821 RepID=A0A151TLV3_CAJCA|nr:Retrovirus-related Pol polyprotein from transposon TNT 1-94 [Cajanus cajan]